MLLCSFKMYKYTILSVDIKHACSYLEINHTKWYYRYLFHRPMYMHTSLSVDMSTQKINLNQCYHAALKCINTLHWVHVDIKYACFYLEINYTKWYYQYLFNRPMYMYTSLSVDMSTETIMLCHCSFKMHLHYTEC